MILKWFYLFIFLNIIALWLLIFLYKPWNKPILHGPENSTLYVNDDDLLVHSFNIADIYDNNIQFDNTKEITYYLDIVRNMYYSLGSSIHLGKTFNCNFVNLSSFDVTIQNYETYTYGGTVETKDKWNIINGTDQTIVVPGNSSVLVEFVFSSIDYTTNQVLGSAYVVY